MAAGFFTGFTDRLRRRVPPTETAGTSGTVILAGYVQSREKNPSVANQTARYATFSDILTNTDIVGASARYFLNLGAKATWTVKPADDSPAAKEVAEFIDDAIHKMRTPWRRVVRRTLMYRYYGFSVQEWTAKLRDDGKVGLLDIEPRPQHTIDRWDTDESGHVIGIGQRDPATGSGMYLPREKVVYVVDDSLSDSPEGLGIFRHMVETSARLTRYQELEAFGFESDLKGIPKGRAPYAVLSKMVSDNTITEEQRKKIVAPLEDFVENHVKSLKLGLMLDSSTYRNTDEGASVSGTPLWDLELVTGGNTSADAVARAIERLQRELARLAGTEGLLLGGAQVGSLALSQDKSQNFALVVDSALADLKGAYEIDVVGTLIALNGIDTELAPTLEPEQVQYRDISQLSQFLVDMSAAGAVLAPDDEVINVMRQLAGLPDVPEIDEEDLNLRLPGGEPPPDPDDPDNQPDEAEPGDVDDDALEEGGE
jgi:hypothetical protein